MRVAEYSFQEVMRNMARMCKMYWPDHEKECDERCPLYKLWCANVDVDFPRLDRDPKEMAKVEEAVMSWAAEHPEPVYPSVSKYLERLGIIIRRDGTLEADFFKAHEPMSADVAKLLGVDLVEGENEKAD